MQFKNEWTSIPKNTLFRLFTRFAEMVIDIFTGHEWPQCHGSLYLTSDFRKPLNNQYILGIASANSSPTIRLSRNTQQKLCKKCTLYESFVGCDAIFINLLKKTSSVINTCVCNFKIFFLMISNTVLKQNTISRLQSGCWTHIRIN